MKIKAIVLENFRSFRERTVIPLQDLTAFVGRNDAGKSTILEALEIFFNSEQVKFDKHDRCVHQEGPSVRIGCVFTDFPTTLTIDARAQTSLNDEFLLNQDGDLEIHKIYDCSTKTPKETNVAITLHPRRAELVGLLYKTNDELKTLVRGFGIDPTATDIDLRSNVQLRRAARMHFGNALDIGTC